jgi:hypothetical protein
MLLSGIQARGAGPPIQTFGGDVVGGRAFYSQTILKGEIVLQYDAGAHKLDNSLFVTSLEKSNGERSFTEFILSMPKDSR